jgi:hypothetical protein
MQPRKDEKQVAKAPQVRSKQPKPRLRIVKLEPRIAPGIALNHNETLVREPAKAKPAPTKRPGKKDRFRVVKLEERIAPGLSSTNHNETLVRDRAAGVR